MAANTGKVVGVNGNMVTVEIDGIVSMNEVGFVVVGDKRLKSEVIRIRGNRAEVQVFEMTRGIGIGDPVEFTSELLAVRLGPGLLGQVYDGLQNPLPELAREMRILPRTRRLPGSAQRPDAMEVHPFGPERRYGHRGRFAGHGPRRYFRAPDHGSLRHAGHVHGSVDRGSR